MTLDVGTAAPDFTLKDQNNQEITLSSFKGEKNVLLVFYPLAFTGTCQ
ncbi:MAG: redoxin domain-containing protein, partial [Mycobacteriaceae bacterium]